jgi:hypothetical protein
MTYYHYGPPKILDKVKRLGQDFGWEFLESPQDQSEGKPKACYLTKLSPEDLAKKDRPVARVLGLKATEGKYWQCFEMKFPDEWSEIFSEKKARTDLRPIRIEPIKGDRGKTGIALYMVKGRGGAYEKSLDEGVDANTDYIYVNREYCGSIYTISTTGKVKEVNKEKKKKK